MIFLERKLNQWKTSGLLDDEQVSAILAHETQGSSKKSWFAFAISAIGILAIVLGIISIVAANWDKITPEIKLACYLSLQSLLGVILYFLLPKTNLAKEAFIGLFALFFFAGIGLTAQIFNIHSDGWSGILFWCALSLPVVLYSRTRPIAYLWFALLMLAESIWLISKLDRIYLRQGSWELVAFYYYAMALLTLQLLLALALWSEKRILSASKLPEASKVLSILAIVIGITTLGSISWYVDWGKEIAAHGSKMDWTLIGVQVMPWLGSIIAAAAIWAVTSPGNKRVAALLCAAFLGLAAYIAIPVILHLGRHELVSALFIILIWWLLALSAAYAGKKILFDLATIFIAIRILVIFFEVFGSMLATGIGLIISGTMILLIAWLWYQYRDRVVTLVKSS